MGLGVTAIVNRVARRAAVPTVVGVLSPPDDLAEETLAAALARGWSLDVASTTYRPVGFGSHHWDVLDSGGRRWFGTVDDLTTKRLTLAEPLGGAFDRLRAALATAAALRESGRRFVVAPVPTVDGRPVVRVGERYAMALYPFVTGRSFRWQDSTPEHPAAVLDLLLAVHAAPVDVRRHAMVDDFAIPHRDEVDAALDSGATVEERGPYSRATADLLAGNTAVRRLLARYDDLVGQARAAPDRAVLTHGEPHPGNTMLTDGGWLLIDWDTTLVAPPERDLWDLDPGDGSVLEAYAAATGVRPLPSMIEMHRIRWDLSDIACEVSRFRGRHTGSADDDKGWDILRSHVARLSGFAN